MHLVVTQRRSMTHIGVTINTSMRAGVIKSNRNSHSNRTNPWSAASDKFVESEKFGKAGR